MQSSLKFIAQRKRALLCAVSPKKVQNINVQTKTDLIMEVDKNFPQLHN